MRPTLQTRKPIDKLQLEDLATFPIWEFAIDEEENEEQDETWVRPLAAKVIEPDLYSLSVAAEFETASGHSISGFVGVTTAGAFEFGHGVLLPQGQYIFVPSAEFPDAKEERKAVAKALRMKESDVFPLKFTLKTLVRGESSPRRGEFK